MKRYAWSEPERYLIDTHTFSEFGLNICKRTLDSSTALHWHEYCEIEIILSGKMIHHLNGVSGTVGAGSLYFLTPADLHTLEVLEPVELINVSFSDLLIPTEFLSAFMSERHAPAIPLPPDTFTYLRMLAEKLYEEFHQNKPHRESYIKSLLNCIFVETDYAFPTADNSDTQRIPDPVRRVLMHLYCYFRESPSLHAAAEIAGLSDNYFCEVFRKATGHKYNRFLNDLKLRYARDLLISSDASITEICFSSGFDSLTHFQREFKEKYHCSCSDMRKQQRASNAAKDKLPL